MHHDCYWHSSPYIGTREALATHALDPGIGFQSRHLLQRVTGSAAYRNAALTAKMISTLDAISAGRAELGLGAGWKRDEWRAYGYGFPD
ncbi:MAG: LLM class flavin-dependent oxidoreductase, partial [Byssovorax sp.]